MLARFAEPEEYDIGGLPGTSAAGDCEEIKLCQNQTGMDYLWAPTQTGHVIWLPPGADILEQEYLGV